jgi:hypothetical protein
MHRYQAYYVARYSATLPLEKKRENFFYDETFALVTGTGFVLPLAVNWANRLDLEERP